MINLQTLAERINGIGIMDKAFIDCTRDEIEALCQAVMNSFDDSVPAEGWQPPCIVGDELVISFRSHPKYHWWNPKGQSIIDTLLELRADWRVAKKYLDTRRINEDDYLNLLVPF